MSGTICICYISHNLNTGKDENTLARDCPVHLAEATKFYQEYDRKADEAAARTKAIKFEGMNEKARKAASEICSAFEIRQPRGVRYHSTNEETIAIIIAQNMKGLHR